MLLIQLSGALKYGSVRHDTKLTRYMDGYFYQSTDDAGVFSMGYELYTQS